MAWLQGKVAMIYSWPPTGRMSANYTQTDKALQFVPRSTVAGKVDYPLVPGNPATRAWLHKGAVVRFPKCYLFHAVGHIASHVTCACNVALRDSRSLPAVSLLFGSLPVALADYLRNLNSSANVAVLDLIMPGSQDYALALDRMCTSVWAGVVDRATALKIAAAEWDTITGQLGVGSQRAAYEEFMKLPGSSPDRAVQRLGLAVELRERAPKGN